MTAFDYETELECQEGHSWMSGREEELGARFWKVPDCPHCGSIGLSIDERQEAQLFPEPSRRPIDRAQIKAATRAVRGPDSLEADCGIANSSDVIEASVAVATRIACDNPQVLVVDEFDVLLASACAYGVEVGLRLAQLHETEG